MPALLPPAKPRLTPARISSTSGKRSAIASAEPSTEPLSTTTVVDPAQRLERGERVLAAVPGDDDGDDVHQVTRVKCAIEPASGWRSKRSSSRSISPTSRAIPG